MEENVNSVSWAIKMAKQWYCESCNTLLSDMSLEYCTHCRSYRYAEPRKYNGPSVSFYDPSLREFLENEKKRALSKK